MRARIIIEAVQIETETLTALMFPGQHSPQRAESGIVRTLPVAPGCPRSEHLKQGPGERTGQTPAPRGLRKWQDRFRQQRLCECTSTPSRGLSQYRVHAHQALSQRLV